MENQQPFVDDPKSRLRRILIVEDDPVTRKVLESVLVKEGYQVSTASSAEEAFLALETDRPSVILSDINLPGISGLDLQVKLREIAPHVAMILITSQDDMATAIKATQQGAYDYLTKPVDYDRLKLTLGHLTTTLDLSEKLKRIVSEEAEPYKLDNMLIGKTSQMQDIYKTIGRISNSRVTVLIEGESGTGKELIARAIHYNSTWSDEPFIAVNCSALTETLLESELFGHVKGSFTGAMGDKQGKLELAKGGTIFLDEIGEISPSLQVKLLRVLQQREFEPVGAEYTLPLIARVVTATNRNLRKEVAEGRFREDLYYRLNVVSVTVPPLRDRRDDLPILVKGLIERINKQQNARVSKVSDEAMRRILSHDWPGNVRELENTLTRAIVLSKSDVIEAEAIPDPQHKVDSSAVYNWRRPLDEVEREHILRVLEGVNGNRTEAARILGISKQTLYSKLPKEALAKS